MRALATLLGLLLAAPLGGLAGAPAPEGGPYHGLDAWAPGMGYWAPITRSFAFVEGKGVMFHSLDPVLMPTDPELSRIYQFPNCPGLRPVLADDTPQRDSPQRRIIDIVLASCAQPTSEEAIFAPGNVVHRNLRQMFVNAPVVPEPYASWGDTELFNGPPFRPRIDAFQDGQPVRFITYDASWLPPWAGTGFPGHNVDVYLLSDDAVWKAGETLLSLFNGAPVDVRAPVLEPLNPVPGTHQKYSPVWKATCIVPEGKPWCGALRGPEYEQCYSIGACTSIEGTRLVQPPGFEFVNCPVVNTDVDGDRFLGANEEFSFPDLWRDGPVLLT